MILDYVKLKTKSDYPRGVEGPRLHPEGTAQLSSAICTDTVLEEWKWKSHGMKELAPSFRKAPNPGNKWQGQYPCKMALRGFMWHKVRLKMWWRHQESGDAGSMRSLPTEGALSTERSKPKREAVWATDHRTRSDQTNSSPDNATEYPRCWMRIWLWSMPCSDPIIPCCAPTPLLYHGNPHYMFVCWKYVTS